MNTPKPSTEKSRVCPDLEEVDETRTVPEVVPQECEIDPQEEVVESLDEEVLEVEERVSYVVY